MANVRVTAGGEKLLSLVTFFAAAKKVTPAPGRGSANRPPRTRDPAKTKPSKPQILPNRRQPILPIDGLHACKPRIQHLRVLLEISLGRFSRPFLIHDR